MSQRGVFELIEPLRVDFAHPASITRISLRLQAASYERNVDGYGLFQENVDPFLSISGFPRVLSTQESIASAPHSDGESEATLPVSALPPLTHSQSEPDIRRLINKVSKGLSRPNKLEQASQLHGRSDTHITKVSVELPGHDISESS